jgi:hypothetical protein
MEPGSRATLGAPVPLWDISRTAARKIEVLSHANQIWSHIFRSTSIVLFLLLWSCIGIGQVLEHARDKGPSEKRLDALLDRVSGLPAEYKADLSFSIIDANPSSLSPARRRAALNDVFHSAGSAHYPYRATEAAGHLHADTLSHVTSNMLSMLKLDTLDIRTRSVERALLSSPQFAAQLFEKVNLPEVRASCKDATVEDISPFYITAKAIIEDTHVKTLFRQGKASYLRTLASNIRVPAQIAPLANLIADAHLSPESLRDAVAVFVVSLGTITASDREMTAAEEGGHLTQAIESVVATLTQSRISSEPLLAAYGDFLRRSLTQERCADYSLDRSELARRFNALLPATTVDSSSVSRLSIDQLSPKAMGDSAPYEIIPFNEQLMPKLQRIFAAHKARFAEEYRSGQPGTIEPEASDVDEVVRYAISIEPGGVACSVCEFDSKAFLFMSLVDILPAGAQLERAINAESDYLSFNTMQNDDPIAWLALFRHLVNDGRKPTEKVTAALTAEAKKGGIPWGLPSPEADVIRSRLHGSADPIMAAYMLTDDLLHLPYLTMAQQVAAK